MGHSTDGVSPDFLQCASAHTSLLLSHIRWTLNPPLGEAYTTRRRRQMDAPLHSSQKEKKRRASRTRPGAGLPERETRVRDIKQAKILRRHHHRYSSAACAPSRCPHPSPWLLLLLPRFFPLSAPRLSFCSSTWSRQTSPPFPLPAPRLPGPFEALFRKPLPATPF